MSEQTIGKIPEFTTDDSQAPEGETQPEEVKEPAGDEPAEDGDSTPVELPATDVPEGAPDQDELQRALAGLQNERAKLLREVSELKGQRREIKREQLLKVEERMDELNDLNPNDVSLIERVIRAKGFITKDESNKMFYESVKQDTLGKFLEKYPEYKPENDPGDTNWTLLQRELGFYRMPEDPHQIQAVLERAHRNVVRVPTSTSTPAKRRIAQVASVGSGGAQRSSSSPTIDARKRALLEAGGWTKEEIERIEKRSR